MGRYRVWRTLKKPFSGVVKGGVNAVLMHKGHVTDGHRGRGKDVGLIIHLSASTILSPSVNRKVLVCTVEEALRLGADGVSIHVNLGAENDSEMLKDFGEIGKRCSDWGMPLMAMMYTRGAKITNEYDVDAIKLAARVANELGADMVKVNFTGDSESFSKVVNGCSIPVLIAGGEKAKSTIDILKNVKMAMDAGGGGVSIGRNIFQDKNPLIFARRFLLSCITRQRSKSQWKNWKIRMFLKWFKFFLLPAGKAFDRENKKKRSHKGTKDTKWKK